MKELCFSRPNRTITHKVVPGGQEITSCHMATKRTDIVQKCSTGGGDFLVVGSGEGVIKVPFLCNQRKITTHD